MNLEPLVFLNGILSTITVAIGAIVGIIIASRYFKYKRKEFMYIGLAVIGIYQPWWPTAVDFFSILFFNRSLTPTEYFIISTVCIPFFIVIWMVAITYMFDLTNKKVLPITFLIISVVGSLYVFIFALIDPKQIGTLTGYFNVEYEIITMGYLLFILLSIVVSGILFSVQSLNSDNPEIRLKGKLLITGFICYLVGGFMDAGTIHLTELTLIITRSILITSAILFYLGFLLPNYVKKLFLREKTI